MANNEKNDPKQTYKSADQSGTGAEKNEMFERFMQVFLEQNANADTPFDTGKLDDLRDRIDDKLVQDFKAVSVAFPECSDVLLSLIKSSDTDEITKYFNEYFSFGKHSTMAEGVNLTNVLDADLRDCLKGSTNGVFPPFWCLPAPCVKLEGDRRTSETIDVETGGTITLFVKRLFMADLVWLFYFDRMGIFKILGAILDDYAIKGKFPITNDSNDANDKIELISIVLEAMTRKTKMGISSTVRDRNISYRRALGWILEEGRKLNLDTVVNTAFTNLFHKFIQTSLEYFKDKRLATAIQASTNTNRVSVATLTSIKDTIDLILRAFDPFKYGRVYSNTLSGIVWVIAAMALIREMRTTLGISSEYRKPDEFIPAAYDLLVNKNSGGTQTETNRYDVHRDCAENARDILLDLEAVNFNDTKPGGDLELWLDLIESKVESYRTAYRSLTGVDLGAPGTPVIEQQV